MKTVVLSLSLATALFVGCGESSSQTSAANMTDITVERGPVLQAVVRDANGQTGEELGNGVYRFSNVVYPVESYGGYIDMNRNGSIDIGDIEMKQLRLKTKSGNVMTLGTTLGSDENLTQSLLELGFTEDGLKSHTPSTDRDIAALSDEVYKYCYENNITDPSLIDNAQMQILKDKIHARKSLYETTTLTAAELEQMLMDELNVTSLTSEEIAKLPTEFIDIIIGALPTVALTEEQKYTLAYMWNEERLAKDIYLALNTLTPSTTLYSIATNAEARHVESVLKLIEKYDLNILNTTDYSGGYSASELANYESGSYSLNEISDLYNTLYAKGSASLQDALEVGCMVEVTDITDLDADIQTAQGADDLVMVFENLKSGSYAHYWAFDTALKVSGVSEGCCVLGDTYCKTVEEYPQEISNPNAGKNGVKQQGRK